VTTKRAYWNIAMVAAISILGLIQMPSLQFNYDFDNFFEKDDPEWIFYQEYVDRYRNDNDYLLVGIENPAGIFKVGFLNQIDSLSSGLTAIDGVTKVISPISAKKVINTPLGTVLVPYLHINDSSKLKNDQTQVNSHPNMASKLINDSIQAVCLIVYHERYLQKEKENALSQAIEEIISTGGFSAFHIAGRIQAQSVFVQLIRENFMKFLALSLVLIVAVLYLMFRYIKWVVIPLIVVGLSIILSLGTLVLTGKAIDVLSSMLPTILLITAMSDITHFLTRYFDLSADGVAKTEAIRLSFREVGLATFLTSLTTAIGFSTLLLTDSLPVKNLGIYTAIGVMITYGVTFSLIPAAATLSGTPKTTKGHRVWNFILGKIFVFNLRSGIMILAVYGALLLIALWGISRLVIDTPLIADFPKDHKVTRDFTFFDNYFQGSKPFEIDLKVKSPDKTLFSPKIIAEIGSLDTFLQAEYKSNNLISPAGLAKSLNMANNGGQPEFYQLTDPKDYNRITRQVIQNKRHFPISIVNDDLTSGRITGFTGDVGSAKGLQQHENLKQYLKERVNPGVLEVRLTGTSLLFDLTTEALVDNIIFGLAIAISAVAFIMAILFRSLRMIIISIIPNVLPIIFLAGIMGIFGIPLRLSTSIIFAIAFGIAVDDTIHFLSRFKLELNRNPNYVPALMHTYLSTGKAMIITTLILSAGFSIFIFSSFQATFYTGLLISITLLLALVIDLTLLPILLILFAKK